MISAKKLAQKNMTAKDWLTDSLEEVRLDLSTASQTQPARKKVNWLDFNYHMTVQYCVCSAGMHTYMKN